MERSLRFAEARDQGVEVAIALGQRGSCLKGLADLAGAMREYQSALAIDDAGAAPKAGGRLQQLVLTARLRCAQGNAKGAPATAAETTRILDRANPDQARWFQKFEDALTSCR